MKSLLFAALLSLLALAPALAQVRAVPAFHAIQLSSGIELELTGGPTQHVEVSATPAELASDLQTTVENGVLTLRFESPGHHVRGQRLHVAVTASQLTALTASGGASVKASGEFAAPTFVLEASAGAAVRAGLAVRELAVQQHGGSVVSLSGQATKLTLTAGGGSIFKGEDLRATACQAQATGGSIVQLSAQDSLVASANGGSSIQYHGTPQVTKSVGGNSTIQGI